MVTSISSCLCLSNSVFGFGSIQAVNRARMSGFGFVIFQKRTFTIIVGSLPPSAATHDGSKEANRSDSEEDTLGGGPLTYAQGVLFINQLQTV